VILLTHQVGFEIHHDKKTALFENSAALVLQLNDVVIS